MLGTGLLIGLQPPNHPPPIVHTQKRRLVREIKYHPETRNADQDCRQTLKNEDPRPPALSSDAIHLSNSCSKQPTKRSRHGSRAEEDGQTNTELVALIPTTQIITDPGEKSGLSHAEEPARSHHALEIMAQAHRHHDNAPEDHDDGDEDAGPEAFEQDVGEGLEAGVGDEEDAEGGIVLAGGDVQGVFEAVEAGVADVGAVEEGDEVEEAEPGDEAQVEFPEEAAVLRGWSDLDVFLCWGIGQEMGKDIYYGCALSFTDTLIWIWWQLPRVLAAEILLIIGGGTSAIAVGLAGRGFLAEEHIGRLQLSGRRKQSARRTALSEEM